MATFKTVITTIGAARLATAIANGSLLNLHEMAVGDGAGNPVTPSPAQTTLVHEVYRAQLNDLKVSANNPNWVIAEMVIPGSVGGWTVREVGVYDDEGTLIAVGNFAPTYKPVPDEGSTRDLVIRFIFAVEQPEVISLTIDPAVVLASRQWVQDNFALAILIPGGTTGQVLRKASNTPGAVEWYDPTSGLNLIVDVVEELQELSATQDVVTLLVCTTNGIAVYIDGIRLPSTAYTIDSETQLTLETPATGGESIIIVQNEPANAGDFLRLTNLFKEIQDAGLTAAAIARQRIGAFSSGEVISTIYGTLYPIGEILITHRTGNPSSWMAPYLETVWQRYGEGRVMVGYDAAQTEFNALDKTGGNKATVLTPDNIPAHRHGVAGHNGATASAGLHSHGIISAASPTGSHGHDGAGSASTLARSPTNTNEVGPGVTSVAGAHTHAFSIPPYQTDVFGKGDPFSNLPPYVVVYMWIRVS